MQLTDRALTLVPEPFRSMLIKRREIVKFLLVGGFCFLITVVINYELSEVLSNRNRRGAVITAYSCRQMLGGFSPSLIVIESQD